MAASDREKTRQLQPGPQKGGGGRIRRRKTEDGREGERQKLVPPLPTPFPSPSLSPLPLPLPLGSAALPSSDCRMRRRAELEGGQGNGTRDTGHGTRDRSLLRLRCTSNTAVSSCGLPELDGNPTRTTPEMRHAKNSLPVSDSYVHVISYYVLCTICVVCVACNRFCTPAPGLRPSPFIPFGGGASREALGVLFLLSFIFDRRALASLGRILSARMEGALTM
ncbi:hypothetical protein LZ30DRAFT_173057 [Colletotrichum cereale]|nr:hypothetical protein LZ30DRAFT_173057 [Colletotrichum cereale]